MKRAKPNFLERLGNAWGEFLLQTVRGFEFATAVATLNNALFVLQTRPDGEPVASFLHGAGAFGCPASVWSGVFALLGGVMLALFLASMKGGGFMVYLRERAFTSALLTTLYAVVSLQVLRSPEPPLLAGRYVLTLMLALCVIVLLVRLLWNEHLRNRLATKGTP